MSNFLGHSTTLGEFPKQILTFDGVTDTFLLNRPVNSPTTILVVVDGQVLEPQVDYTVDGNNLITTSVLSDPASGYVLHLGTEVTVPTPANGTAKQYTFTGDGTTVDFSLSGLSAPLLSSHLLVFVDGAYKRYDVDYVETHHVITFTTAPANGAHVIIHTLGVIDYDYYSGIVNSDLTVLGSLTVQGENLVLDSQQLSVQDPLVLINSDKTGFVYAGVEIGMPDQTNRKIVYSFSSGRWEVGQGNSTVPLALLSEVGDSAELTAHIADTSNPHSVTRTQVGLGNVTNDAQLRRDVSDFNTLTAIGTPDFSNDLLVVEDASNSFSKRKITLEEVIPDNISGLGEWVFTTVRSGTTISDLFRSDSSNKTTEYYGGFNASDAPVLKIHGRFTATPNVFDFDTQDTDGEFNFSINSNRQIFIANNGRLKFDSNNIPDGVLTCDDPDTASGSAASLTLSSFNSGKFDQSNNNRGSLITLFGHQRGGEVHIKSSGTSTDVKLFAGMNENTWSFKGVTARSEMVGERGDVRIRSDNDTSLVELLGGSSQGTGSWVKTFGDSHSTNANEVHLGRNAESWILDSGNNLKPAANFTADIGTTSNHVNNIYCANIKRTSGTVLDISAGFVSFNRKWIINGAGVLYPEFGAPNDIGVTNGRAGTIYVNNVNTSVVKTNDDTSSMLIQGGIDTDSPTIELFGESHATTPNLIVIDSPVTAIRGAVNYVNGTTLSTNAYAATITGIDALYDGLTVTIRVTQSNTNAARTDVTFNLNSLGAKDIKVFNSKGKRQVIAGEIRSLGIHQLTYVSATDEWILLNPAPIEGYEVFNAVAATVINRSSSTFGELDSVTTNTGAFDIPDNVGLQMIFTVTTSCATANRWVAILPRVNYGAGELSLSGTYEYIAEQSSTSTRGYDRLHTSTINWIPSSTSITDILLKWASESSVTAYCYSRRLKVSVIPNAGDYPTV